MLFNTNKLTQQILKVINTLIYSQYKCFFKYCIKQIGTRLLSLSQTVL